MPDFSEYCRDLESYLCRKNGGHLVRIVGPAFEMVCGWAERGVPLTVAYRGIDRYCERLQARGGRRRPVRIEFCEGDILDLFDDWRRAVGVVQAQGEAEAPAPARKPSLTSHLDRVVARLVELDRAFIEAASAELDPGARETARREADAELAPFGSRLAPDVRAKAVEAAFERLVRDSLGLPQIRYQ